MKKIMVTSEVSAGRFPRHQSGTPAQESMVGSEVTSHEAIDGKEHDSSDDSFSDSDGELLELDSRQRTDEPEGFLKAKNGSDSYFLAHGKPHPTSAQQLSARPDWKRALPVSDYLGSFDPQPLESARTTWSQWSAELAEGYSLLFYGLGSKRATLNAFVQEQLVEGLGWEGLVVNGFQTGAGLASIVEELEEMAATIVGTDGGREEDHPAAQRKFSSWELLEARARQLCARLAGSAGLPGVALLIHNLDGAAFRKSRAQSILGLLAGHPSIHLIASIDHIYAPVLLPSHLASPSPYATPATTTHTNTNTTTHTHTNTATTAMGASSLTKTFPSNYNFLYHHLPTQTPYTLESLLSGTVSSLLPPSVFPPTMLATHHAKSDIAPSGVTTLKATLHVLSSLTERAKSLFRILAEHQLSKHRCLPIGQAKKVDEGISNPGPPSDRSRAPSIAIAAAKLFLLARSQFVASVQSQMEALLLEFRDHAIVLSALNPSAAHDHQPDQDRLVEEEEQEDHEWLWIALGQADLEEVLARLESDEL